MKTDFSRVNKRIVDVQGYVCPTLEQQVLEPQLALAAWDFVSEQVWHHVGICVYRSADEN